MAKLWYVATVCLLLMFISPLSTDNTTQRTAITAQNVHLLQLIAQFEEGTLYDSFWTHDGQYIYVSGSLGMWRFDANQLDHAPTHFGQYFAPVAFSPDNRIAASLNKDHDIVLWDVQTGQFVDVFYDVGARLIWITDLAFSPDGNLLVMSFGGGGTLRPTGGVTVWDVQTQREIVDIRHQVEDPNALVFHPDGKWLATGGYIGLRIWDTTNWENLLPISGGSWIRDLIVSSNGQWLAYLDGRSRHPVLFDTIQPDAVSCELEYEGFPPQILARDIAFSPNDPAILAIARGERLELWDIAECEKLSQTSTPINAITFSPDGTQIVGVHGSGILLYDVEGLTETAHTEGFIGLMGGMVFSDDSKLFAYERSSTISTAPSVRVWETEHFSEVMLVTPEIDINTLTHPFLQTRLEQRSWQSPTDADSTRSGVF
jgi:WD40 repeat protein